MYFQPIELSKAQGIAGGSSELTRLEKETTQTEGAPADTQTIIHLVRNTVLCTKPGNGYFIGGQGGDVERIMLLISDGNSLSSLAA